MRTNGSCKCRTGASPSFTAVQDGEKLVFAPVEPAVLERYSGVHAMEGIFAMAGSGVLPDVNLGIRDITDVTPTLLALLGLPVPSDADGRVMLEALLAPNVAIHNAPAAVRDASPSPALTPEEEAALARSLSSLGYLE